MRSFVLKSLFALFSLSTLIFFSIKFPNVIKSQACTAYCSPPYSCSITVSGVEQCCNCVNGPGSYGPVTCCTPPGSSGCSTYNVGGCAAAPPPPPTSGAACPTFKTGSCNPSVLNQGQTFNIICDFGRLTDCIGALPGCTFTGWIGTTTQAQFTCVAPTVPGNISGYCSLYNTSLCPGCSGSWTGSSCSVVSSVPNCSNVTGPTSLTLGQAGLYRTNLYSPGSALGGEINYFDGTVHRIVYGDFTPPNAVIVTSWTPSAVGSYSVCCRAWNDGVAECRPSIFGGIGGNVFSCAGPNSCLTVNVVQPSPTPTPTPTTCPLPSIVSGNTPVGITASCLNQLTFSWNAVPGADHYAIRIDEDPDSWSGTCSSINPGDTCNDIIFGTSFNRSVTPGRSYSWWVDAINSCGWSGTALRYTVTVPACPTNTPTPTPTPTSTSTPTPIPTNTPRPTPTSTPRPTNTPIPTVVYPTSTPRPTPTSTGSTIETFPDVEKTDFTRLYRAIQPLNIGAFYFSTSLTLGNIISALLRFIFPIFGLIFILLIIYGGFKFMTSAGNPQAIQSAKSVIITAFLGFVLIFLAYWITKLMANILGLSDISSMF
jgi:Type IV secretion system pilin